MSKYITVQMIKKTSATELILTGDVQYAIRLAVARHDAAHFSPESVDGQPIHGKCSACGDYVIGKSPYAKYPSEIRCFQCPPVPPKP